MGIIRVTFFKHFTLIIDNNSKMWVNIIVILYIILMIRW